MVFFFTNNFWLHTCYWNVLWYWWLSAGLARYNVYLTCHRIDKIIAPLFVSAGPTLRLKTTATYTDFRWCMSLVLVLWFSQRKCFFLLRALDQWTKFTSILLLELKRYWSKVKVEWKKNVFHQNNCARWDFAQKCQYSWIFGKTKFLGKCLFSPWNVLCD